MIDCELLSPGRKSAFVYFRLRSLASGREPVEKVYTGGPLADGCRTLLPFCFICSLLAALLMMMWLTVMDSA